MPPTEFKAWLCGFAEGIDAAPSPEQWQEVLERVDDLSRDIWLYISAFPSKPVEGERTGLTCNGFPIFEVEGQEQDAIFNQSADAPWDWYFTVNSNIDWRHDIDDAMLRALERVKDAESGKSVIYSGDEMKPFTAEDIKADGATADQDSRFGAAAFQANPEDD
jgi:hypothetical protein